MSSRDEFTYSEGELQTIECIASGKHINYDTRLMVCALHARTEPTRRIEGVWQVAGDIRVISAYKPNTIYIKTAPYIAMPVKVVARQRVGVPEGVDLIVTTSPRIPTL